MSYSNLKMNLKTTSKNGIGRVMCKRQLFYFIFNLHSQSCNLAELLKCIKNPAATSLIVLDIFNGYSTESRPACIRK